jgi:hypothetical protein
VFLQHPIEADELLGPRTRGAHLDKEVLLYSLGSDAIGTMFRAHLFKGVLK